MESASTPLNVDTPRDERASSAFLQDMIKEKKSQTQRIGRARDFSASSYIRDASARDLHSSPIPGARDKSSNTGRKVSATRAQAAPKDMGLRELQEHMSRIDKQNFDLKLEIFHRRQKCDALESRLEKLELLEKENEQLRAHNDELRVKLEVNEDEIETREIAIEEAVGMICELEAKVEDYEHDLEKYRAIVDAEFAPPPPPIHVELQKSSPLPEESSAPPPVESASSRPQPPSVKRVASITSGPKSPIRPPSFLHDERKSNTALRSLYSLGNPSTASFHRDSGAYSDSGFDEEIDRQIMASPRLSILSETGFSSIMGHARDDNANQQLSSPPSRSEHLFASAQDIEERTAQRRARINKWVEDSKVPEPPRTPVRQASNKQSDARISSIGELLDDPSRDSKRPSDTTASPPSHRSQAAAKTHISANSESSSMSPSRSLRKSMRASDRLPPPIIATGPFTSSHLPPTPETMSTATIGPNSSTPSFVTERSLADGTIPSTKGYASLVSGDSSFRSTQSQNRRRSIPYEMRVGSDEALQDESISTSGQQGESARQDQTGFMSGSLKATRFYGSDAPRRPALNTHVTDMMFNGDGFSPKRASRTVSYPSAPRARERASTATSPTSQRSSTNGSNKTITSPRRTQPSPSKAGFAPAPAQYFADIAHDTEPKTRQTSTLRFLLPKHHVASATTNNNNQSVASRIFRRNRFPAAEPDFDVEEVDQKTRPSSGHRPGLSDTISASALARPGTADGSTRESTRPISDATNRRWTITRRHSAVLDDSFIVPRPDKGKPLPPLPLEVSQAKEHTGLIRTLDEDTGLGRVVDGRTTVRGGDDGMFRNTKARLRDGFGLRKRGME